MVLLGTVFRGQCQGLWTLGLCTALYPTPQFLLCQAREWDKVIAKLQCPHM